MIKVAIRDHQNKGKGLYDSLWNDERFEPVQIGDKSDILLIDHDVTVYYQNIINLHKAHGSKVVLYPHGATAHLAWDGPWPVYRHVDAFLAMSSGQSEVMRMYGYPKPVYNTGWHWCDIKPFQEPEGGRVLFAPIHALNNGFIHPNVKALNYETFSSLMQAGVDLKVRFVGDLEACGIPRVEGVRYRQGQADNSIQDIDLADYVVSFGTFAYLAVARGKPTMMYRQDLPYFDGHTLEDIRYAEHWDEYGDYMRYPAEDMRDAADEALIFSWRSRFIGKQMQPGKLGDILEKVLDA